MRTMTLFSSLTLALGAFLFTGCGGTPASIPAKNAGGEEHAHEHAAPHGGTLIELGKEEYHAELVHDEAAHKVTIYVYDGAVKNPVAIAEKEVSLNLVANGSPMPFKLPAAPQAGDGEGKSSKFELIDEKLCDALDAKGNQARLTLNIQGAQFVGDIEEHDHEHEHK